jgi:hypothetical protein
MIRVENRGGLLSDIHDILVGQEQPKHPLLKFALKLDDARMLVGW